MPNKGRGKRRGSNREPAVAKKRAVSTDTSTMEPISSVEETDHPGKNSGVVDFEQILRASEQVAMPASSNTNNEFVLDQIASQNPSVHCVESAPGQNVESLRCSSDEIFVHVPRSLRQQICKGEYINLALLLKGGMELSEFCSGGTLKLNTEGGIEMKTKVCKEKISSIDKWTDAFIIYSSIYISTHADQATQLLHYMYIIREAASRQKGFAWRSYDEQFRLRQANFPSSWSTINNDLWWRCMQIQDTVDPVGVGAVQTKSYTCNDFNRGFCRWPVCRFPHVCSGCGASQHGAWSCPNKPSSSVPQPSSGSFRGHLSRPFFRYQRGRGPRSSGSLGRGFSNRQRPY